MSQQTLTSYALLGSGRLATHLAFYLKSLGLPFKSWSRRSGTVAELQELAASSSHVLFAVSDRAIEELSAPFISSGRTLVHFSGAVTVEGVYSAHPLMTFGSSLEDADWYPLIPFVVSPGVKFESLLPGLPNHAFSLEDAKRPLYHALCSLAGNSAFLLWQQIGAEFERSLDLPSSLLQPFLHQTVANALQNRPQAFTGPVARGDWSTVEKHLKALAATPALLHAYQNFLKLAKDTGHAIPEALL